MDGFGNLYPDSDGYVGYDEKQQQRSDILKLILYDLNSAICPRDMRLLAIKAALEEFDHNDEALHDEELELRADHILLQKLTFAMSINPSSDEVGYITSALEAVYRGGRTRLAQSFHEICDALMPLFVEMIRPPAGWSPQILQQLTANQNGDNLLQQQNKNESLKGDERSIATKSLGGTSQRSKDPSIILQFQKSDPSFAPQTYYGDYDEESAESVQIPSGTGEYFEQMERMNSTGSGIPSTAPGGEGGGVQEDESPGVGFPPPSEYFDEMNRRSSTGETSRDSTGNNAALVIDKRLSSFGVAGDSTGNDQALVLQSFGGEGQIVAADGGGGGNVDTIRNDLDDAQAVLNQMDTTGTGADANENSLRSSTNSHDSYAAFLQQEKEKMAAASAEDEDSFDSRRSSGVPSPPQVDDYESSNQPPVVAPYDSEEDMIEEPPVVAPYDSEDECMGEEQPPVVAPFDDPDQPPVVAPFDDSEEEDMGNAEHDHDYEGEDGGNEAMPLRGGGGDINDGEVEDVTNEYAQDNPFADMAGIDNPFADIAGLSASVFNQGMTGGRAGSMAFSEQSSQNFDDQGGYSGAAPAIFSGYDDDASKIRMGGDQSQVSYRSGGPQDQEGGESFAPGFEGINRHKFESEQSQKNYNRKSSELSGVSEDNNMRRLSAVTDEWGGMDPSDRDPSMMGFPPPNNSKQQQFDPIMESMSQFKIGGDGEIEAEEKYSDFPYEGDPDDGGGNNPDLPEPLGQQEQDLDDIFQFQEPRLSMTSEQDYFNYSDPVEGEVCSLAVRKVIKILRYFSRVLSAMEPLAQQTGLVDALLYHMTKKPLSTDYDDEIASRVDAIAVVVNLACAEENKIMLVYHPGLLDAVINIANHDPIDEAREHAAIVLMNLAYAEENKVHMVNQEYLLDTLVHLLSDVSPFTRRYASAALFTLACTYANTAVMARHCDGGILEALRKVLLNDPIDEARVNASEALFNMARNNSDDTVENMGNHPRLLASLAHSVLTDYSADVRAYSARALEWLSADIHHPMACHRILLKALTMASQWTKTTCIAEALKMQASFSDNRKPMVEHPGLLDALATLAQLDGINDDEVRASAISAVERLSKEASTRQIMVKNQAIMGALTKATFSSDAEDETALLMKTALKNLSAHL